MPPKTPRAILAIVGAGPRGTSLIERIGANLSVEHRVGQGADPARHPLDTPASPTPIGPALDLHIIDDAQSGAGSIWRTDQDRELCMNTLADAVTLFTEPGSSIEGPVVQGPTLYEWCLLAYEAGIDDTDEATARSTGGIPTPHPGTAATVVGPDPHLAERCAAIPPARRAAFTEFPARAGIAQDYRVELAALRPESHPSRALYGEYLAWCYDRAVAALPANVRVIRHRSRVIGAERATDRLTHRELLRLADGSQLRADAVVFATGWMPHAQTEAERGIERHLAEHPAFTWVRPGSPVDQNLSSVPDGAHAIVRGLGMGFFDATALLTIGRGGRFVTDPTAPGGLRYEASGREPVLHVTSRRGVPFRAKSLYGSLPPRTEQRFLRAVDWETVPRPINFDRWLWPRIVADAYTDFATTLHRTRPEAFSAPIDTVLEAISRALDELLNHAPKESPGGDAVPSPGPEAGRLGSAAPPSPSGLDTAPTRMNQALATHIPEPTDRFDLLAEMHPVTQRFASAADYDAWVRERVADDLREAERGRDSAVKAGLWSVSTARALANRIGTLGAFDAESRGSGFATVMAVGALAGSGPPAFRNRQLLALAHAGLVHFVGPGARLVLDERGFTTMSPAVTGGEVSAPVLIDAWMHFHDVGASADPLTTSLLNAGRARAFRVRTRAGGTSATEGFDIDGATGQLMSQDGVPDQALHMVGIPVDAALHDTVISPMPGTDPPMLRETDRAARSAIRSAAAASCTASHPTTHSRSRT